MNQNVIRNSHYSIIEIVLFINPCCQSSMFIVIVEFTLMYAAYITLQSNVSLSIQHRLIQLLLYTLHWTACGVAALR